MKITFEIDDNEVLAALRAVMNGHGDTAATSAPDETPAPRRATKKAAAAPPQEPDDEPDEDLLGGDEYTMQDAVDRATELISAGKQPVIKKALADLGAKRVADLKGDQIREFIEALG